MNTLTLPCHTRIDDQCQEMSTQMNEKLLINWFISDRTFALRFIRFVIALLIDFKRSQFHPIKLTPIYLRKVDYN